MNEIWAASDSALVESVAPLALMAPPQKPIQPATNKHERIAVVDVVGVLTRYGLSSYFRGSYGTSTEEIRQTANRLRNDPSVAGVVFRFDSPGGSVSGLAEAGDAIAELQRTKPTVAHPDGMCCSAAYWLASQCGSILPTRGSLLGSIGNYIVVIDPSEALSKAGIRVVVVRSSALKGAGADGAAVSDDQIADLQRRVDALQAMFNEAVALGRGMTKQQVEKVATGQVWFPDEAMKLGLCDAASALPESALRRAGWSPPDQAAIQAKAKADEQAAFDRRFRSMNQIMR